MPEKPYVDPRGDSLLMPAIVYTGPLVTPTLLFIGLRGNEAPDLVFGNADVGRELTVTPELRALDKATGENGPLGPAGCLADRYSDDLHDERPALHRTGVRDRRGHRIGRAGGCELIATNYPVDYNGASSSFHLEMP